MEQFSVKLSRWLREKVMRERVKKGLLTDRDRWIYIRSSYTKEVNRKFYGGEYDKLCADTRVQKLLVSEDEGIKLTTVPVIKMLFDKGVHYCVYLGTYEIHVQMAPYSIVFESFTIPSTTNFKVNCIQSGRYDAELKSTYPVATEHNFCFGKRKVFIEDLANMGELYTFFNLVLDSLWHVNPTSVSGIIGDFRKITDTNELEPYRSGNATLVNLFDEH